MNTVAQIAITRAVLDHRLPPGILPAKPPGLVHNGIVENHRSLRPGLEGFGYVFTSGTDTEVVADRVIPR